MTNIKSLFQNITFYQQLKDFPLKNPIILRFIMTKEILSIFQENICCFKRQFSVIKSINAKSIFPS